MFTSSASMAATRSSKANAASQQVRGLLTKPRAAVEVVIQARSNYRKIFFLLQHEGFVTRYET